MSQTSTYSFNTGDTTPIDEEEEDYFEEDFGLDYLVDEEDYIDEIFVIEFSSDDEDDTDSVTEQHTGAQSGNSNTNQIIIENNNTYQELKKALINIRNGAIVKGTGWIYRIIDETNGLYRIEELGNGAKTTTEVLHVPMNQILQNYRNGAYSLKEYHGKQQWQQAADLYNKYEQELLKEYKDNWIVLTHHGDIIYSLSKEDTKEVDESTILLSITDHLLLRDDDVLVPVITKVGRSLSKVQMICKVDDGDEEDFIWKCSYQLQPQHPLANPVKVHSIIDTGSVFTICDMNHIREAGNAEILTSGCARGINGPDFQVWHYLATIVIISDFQQHKSLKLDCIISAIEDETPNGNTIVGRNIINRYNFLTMPDKRKYMLLECPYVRKNIDKVVTHSSTNIKLSDIKYLQNTSTVPGSNKDKEIPIEQISTDQGEQSLVK